MKNRDLEVVEIIHARHIRVRVQQPEDLIARLIVIRLIGIAGNAEVDWDDRVAHGSGREQFSRHIFVRLPKNILLGGTIFAGPAHDATDAGKAQVDAMPGIGIEAQMNRALQRPAGSKRQRSKFEISLAEALPPDAGPRGHARQNKASQAKHQRGKNSKIGVAPESGRDRSGNCERNRIPKYCQQPKADGAVAVRTFRSTGRPVLAPEPRRFRIGFRGCRLLSQFVGAIDRGVNNSAANYSENRRDENSHPRIFLALAGSTAQESASGKDPHNSKNPSKNDAEDFSARGWSCHPAIIELR